MVEHHAAMLDRILDATSEVIGEVGYGGATMGLIADRVGVSRNALYRYGSDKADLLGKLMDREVTRFVRALRDELSELAAPEAQMATFIDRQLRYFAGQRAMAHDLQASLGTERHREMLGHLAPLRLLLDEIIEGGARAGVFRSGDTAMTNELVLSAVSAHSMALARGDVDVQAVTDETTAFVLGALRKA